MSTSNFKSNSSKATLVLWILFGCFFLNALYSTVNLAPTQDEGLHYVSGLSYWQFHDYRLQPENGNLPQRLAALPAYLLGYRLPAGYEQYFSIGDQATLATYGLFHEPDKHFYGWSLGRIFILAINSCIIFIVYTWAQKIWGVGGALFSAACIAGCPTFLGHSGLTTSDGLFALLATISLYTLHNCLQKPSLPSALICGLLSGLACATKYSAVGLALTMALYTIYTLLRSATQKGNCIAHLRNQFLASIAIALLAYFTLWAHYGFRYSMYPPNPMGGGQTIRSYESMAALGDPTVAKITWLMEHRILPEAYLHGMAFAHVHTLRRQSYFLGELRYGGWYTYFPVAF